MINLITSFAPGTRMYVAITIILWISAIGSAFMESLPFTATMVYILQDLMGQEVPGVQVTRLIWPLSIGAGIGGIGSVMGSSANLVCMAISNRNADRWKPEEIVTGSDFIIYGFPTLVKSVTIANIWLFLLLIWFDIEP